MRNSRFVKKISPRIPLIESLEERQLLSMTVDIRLAGGGTTAEVTSVGQVINMQVWATVTGTNSTGTDDGVQDVNGSFVSPNTSWGSALGTLQATSISPFNASGSNSGASQDLDGDGDLNVGTTGHETVAASYWHARSGSMTTTGGTLVTNGQSFEVATLTFTVTKILPGNTTNITFIPQDTINGITQVWSEDGVTQHVGTTGGIASPQGTLIVGTSVTLTRNVGEIIGTVFNDTNGNGLVDTGEAPLQSWQVYLDINKDGRIDAGDISVRSRHNGLYDIPDVAPGTYTLRTAAQPGYTATIPAASRTITVAGGDLITGKNFGFTQASEPVTASITGLVFNDKNGNGIKDGKDTRLNKWQVYLDANQNGKLDAGEVSVRSRGSGIYVIPNVAPGTYRVRVNVQDGFRQVSPGGYRLVTISGTEQVTGKNFAETPLALISGTVFNDLNGNGIQDSGEAGLAYWRVFADVNGDGTFSNKTDRGVMTDASGNFAMGILPGGTWDMFASVPTGYKLTTPADGSIMVTVVNGQKKTGLVYGIQKIV